MHRLASSVVVLGLVLSPVIAVAGKPAKGAAASPVQLVRKDLVVGQAQAQSAMFALKYDVTLSGPGMEPKSMSFLSDVQGVSTSTVLAAKGRVPTRVKVAFGLQGTVSTDEQGVKRETAAISGKTYVAQAGAKGVIAVTDEAGQPVGEEETKLVREQLGNELGKENALEKALPKGAMKPGASQPRFAELFESFMEEQMAGSDFADAKVTLTEVRERPQGKVAVFSITSSLIFVSDPSSPMLMSSDVAGTMEVLLDGAWIQSLDLSGDIHFQPTTQRYQQGFRTEGTGLFRLLLTSEPKR
ncbi:hypothetical protein LZ198_24660 [Myxococcus sp. K15C18031901]|uniref:hypothetical protein n=1 Tax=Myxococcus dinghuensis TaxID=2906761 RepID=UPI0020A7E699|nr:hypothetical protein [Myxococcus dinghuensis]MCP3102064.1 hypothetical protein [Myxococcus dinghuensis]